MSSKDIVAFSPNGEPLTIDGLKEYISIKKYLINKIKKSPNYYKQLQEGDLSDYYSLLDELKVKDKNGNLIDDEEVDKILAFKVNEENNDKGEER